MMVSDQGMPKGDRNGQGAAGDGAGGEDDGRGQLGHSSYI